MSSHSECNYVGCPHCVGDGWTKFARKLVLMEDYHKVPLKIRAEIEDTAHDELELEDK